MNHYSLLINKSSYFVNWVESLNTYLHVRSTLLFLVMQPQSTLQNGGGPPGKKWPLYRLCYLALTCFLFVSQVRILHDEMGLTTTTYEGQLSLMSEHVASMNDKLATQTDQVNHSRLSRCWTASGWSVCVLPGGPSKVGLLSSVLFTIVPVSFKINKTLLILLTHFILHNFASTQ